MKLIFFFWVSIITMLPQQLTAQCVATGSKDPSAVTNDPACGSLSWSSLTNVYTSDNSRTTVTAAVLGDITRYLKVTGFGFSIPNGSSICGITVSMEKSASGLLNNITDNSVMIVVNDTARGSDKATGGAWPSSDQNVSYGASNDTWGLTLTPAQVNSSNFGVAISAQINGVSVLPTARIDYINIDIYYNTNPLPVQLVRFAATSEKSYVNIGWDIACESQVDYYTIYKFRKNEWEKMYQVKTLKSHNSLNQYKYTDYNYNENIEQPIYKLEETDINGLRNEVQIIQAVPALSVSPFKVSPNPTNGYLQIEAPGEFIKIYALTGKMIKQVTLGGAYSAAIDISDLSKGFYIVVSSTGKWQKILLE